MNSTQQKAAHRISHLFLFSWPFLRLALILALKNSYSPFCSHPSLQQINQTEPTGVNSTSAATLRIFTGFCTEQRVWAKLSCKSQYRLKRQAQSQHESIRRTETWAKKREALCGLRRLLNRAFSLPRYRLHLLLPVSRPVVRRRTIKCLNRSQESLAGGHWGWKTYIFRI